MRVQINASNRSHALSAGLDQNILYAGLSQGIALAYECGSGTCGTCRARLISGEILDSWPDAPGRKAIKTPDGFLMCQCHPKTDLVVETKSSAQKMAADAFVPAWFAAQITSAKLLTHDVLHLEVDLADGSMSFDAGQFAMVAAPTVSGRRGWSMVNYEQAATRLEFVIKRKPGGGLSQWLFSQDRIGARLELFGPIGHATFRPDDAKNLLCIAGGSGIAGMMSILQRAAASRHFEHHRGDVYFGIRTMQDAFFLESLAEFRRRCGARLSVTIALSDSEPPATAARDFPELVFATGLVHDVAYRRQVDYEDVRAYLAGPPPAVEASIRFLLLQAKLKAENIRYDKFS